MEVSRLVDAEESVGAAAALKHKSRAVQRDGGRNETNTASGGRPRMSVKYGKQRSK